MSEVTVRIVIIREDGKMRAYPSGKVDIEATAATVIQDIKEILQIEGDYDLYVKVNPNSRLNSIQLGRIEGIAVIPVNLRPPRSVEIPS